MGKFAFFWVAVLLGCTHGSISTIPIRMDGVGDVYRYEGRANFAHQMSAADEMIVSHCKNLGSSRPRIIKSEKQDIGYVYSSGNLLANKNQSIFFICE